MRNAIAIAALVAGLLAGCSPISTTSLGSSEHPVIGVPTTTPDPMAGFTTGQKQAIQKAQSYLSHSAFSRTGLISQLQYEGFTPADAQFAVDHITVDWNEQAVKKAKSYLSHSSFSLDGLVDQLQYEGFTPAEAQHGAQVAYNS